MPRSAGGSDPGRVRKNNEDAYHIDLERGIFLVVDGIGGQNAGEKAAEIAVERVRARLERQIGATELRIREAITLANNEIVRAAKEKPEWQGMACVLTLVVLENGNAVVGHVGDSRMYQIRRGEIRKITHDHSPVGQREDAGELNEVQAMKHPRRNEVFRDVGSEEHTPDDPDFIEVARIRFDPDSALLLCSDGLSDQVPAAEILAAVERNAAQPQTAVKELIEAANRAGGKDNVTVVVVAGEQFTAPTTPALPPPPRRSVFGGRVAMFVYGVILTAAGAWFSRHYWVPPPQVITPRVLSVGKGAAYSTIGAASQAAGEGDTIEVGVGDYREQVQLKNGVTLRSQPPLVATLRAALDSKGPAVVADGVKNARISGFLIVGDAQTPLATGVRLTNSNVQVDGLEINGAGIGVEIHGGSPSLEGNTIHDCLTQGILVTGGGTPWISHNSVQKNKVSGLTWSVGAAPVLVGNVFEKNPIDAPPDTDAVKLRERNFLLDPAASRGGTQPLHGGRK